MEKLIRFSFALTPRMQAFIELRNALCCLKKGAQGEDAYGWLIAVQDLNESLFGSTARKPVTPELLGLIQAIQARLMRLTERHVDFKPQILSVCDCLSEYEQTLATHIPAVMDFLSEDALIQAWLNSQKKQDWVAHRLFYPQLLPFFWSSLGVPKELNRRLQEVYAIVTHVDQMLNDFVSWSDQVALGGCDQASPSSKEDRYGLLIVGLERSWVEAGVVPEFSGNRHAVRVRFQKWQMGQCHQPFDQDINYHRMLVPIE